MSQLLFSRIATLSYNGGCSSEQRRKYCSDLCRTNFVKTSEKYCFNCFTCGWFDLSCVLFHPTPDFFDTIHIWRLRRTQNRVSIIVLEPCQHRHGFVAKSIVLLEHKWVLLVPKHLFYWLLQISFYEVNVRMPVDFHQRLPNCQRHGC